MSTNPTTVMAKVEEVKSTVPVPVPTPISISLCSELSLFPISEPQDKGIKKVLCWLGWSWYGECDYRIESCLRPMPGVADPTPEELGDFPRNIQDYYWLEDGLNEEYPWCALMRLTTGLYIYVKASCAFSGFEKTGDIAIYAANHPQTLIDYGMSQEDRNHFARTFNKN